MHQTLHDALGIFDRLNKNPDAWVEKGLASALHGKYEEAISFFDEAIRLEPGYSWAWFGKGAALEKLGRHEESIDCFDEVIRLEPDDFLAKYNKSIVLDMLGRHEEARKCLEEVEKTKKQRAE